ncbi:MAG TPA: class I SAM-dependent methyltransferase [Marmoricola sp.]|nr:class I SAM-dependent methyltransferase [Marmoricola sp.]
MTELPPTRWALEGEVAPTRYLDRFTGLIQTGEDIYGEARLVDAIAKRGSRILDAGAGIGRVAHYLAGAGHEVVACEPDPALVAGGRELYPEVSFLEKDILELGPDDGTFEIIVLVGNVLLFAAEGTQARLLTTLAGLLAPGGRIVAGFHVDDGPALTYPYPIANFEADLATAGLELQHRFGGYELHPAADNYVVALLARATDRDD